MRSCPECGHQTRDDDLGFCAKCGARLPEPEAPPAGSPSPSHKKQKVLVGTIIALAVIVAAAVSVIIFLVVSDDNGDTGTAAAPAGTTITVPSDDDGEAAEEEESDLEGPFTLRVASLDGSLPEDLSEMKGLLEQIAISVKSNGEAAGSVVQPATAADGSILSGQNMSLEIRGTYSKGILEATWTYFRPYGDTNVNGGGYIDSEGQLTKENADCSISGTYNRAWSDGRVQTNRFGQVTIRFAVAD